MDTQFFVASGPGSQNVVDPKGPDPKHCKEMSGYLYMI